jgi:hypothetical protein
MRPRPGSRIGRARLALRPRMGSSAILLDEPCARDPVEFHWTGPTRGNPLEFHWMIRDHDSASNPVEYHWIPRPGLIQWNTTGSQACGSSSEIPLDRKRPAHPVKFHWIASVRLIQWNSTGIPGTVLIQWNSTVSLSPRSSSGIPLDP